MMTFDQLAVQQLFKSVTDQLASWNDRLAIVGLIACGFVTVRLGYRVISALNQHFVGAIHLQQRLSKYGKWAVVTGCTRGLGLEFSYQLAALGFNVVLVGRSMEMVERVANRLRDIYGVQTCSVEIDFAKPFDPVEKLLPQLQGKEIGILINNAGVMYDYPNVLWKLTPLKLTQLIGVNITSLTLLTHLIVKECMVPRKSGLIVNMSSSACQHPTPEISVYAATKKYVGFLSKSLNGELGRQGIHVQSLTPYYIATDMTAYCDLIGQESLFSPSASTYVRHALWTFGRTAETTGYLPHSIQVWLSSWVPESLWMWSSTFAMSYLRNSALKKKT